MVKFLNFSNRMKFIATIDAAASAPYGILLCFRIWWRPCLLEGTKSVNALTDAMNKDKSVFLATQIKAGIDNPKEKDIS